MRTDLKYAGVVALILLLMGGIWYYFNKPAEKVTVMPQEKAETTEGVKEAAKNADIQIDDGQAKEIANEIKERKAPEYTVKTTGNNYKAVVEKERVNNKADYSVVTTKDGKQPDVKADEVVEVNQYNIKAYKKILRTIEYEPTSKTASFIIQRKVTDSGQYIGVGAGYDFSENKVVAKVTYSW